MKEDIFEKMYFLYIEYRLGNITFLEMLDRWEELAGIKPQTEQ